MTPLDYSYFPVALNRYRVTSAYEIQILAWAAMLPEGLKKSNNDLAELLHTDRRTVINSINRLKSKGLIENTGTKYNRILKANSEIVSLLNSDDVSLSGSEKVSQNGEKTDTHNIKNNTYTYTLRDNTLWKLPQEKIVEYERTFPNIDVHRELQKAAQWTIDNPRKRKTADGMFRFLSNWLGRTKPTPEPELPEADTDAIFEKLGLSQEQQDEYKRLGLTA